MNDSPEDQFAQHFLRIIAGELDTQAKLRIGALVPYLIAVRLGGETYCVGNTDPETVLRALLAKLARGEPMKVEQANRCGCGHLLEEHGPAWCSVLLCACRGFAP